ncbi:hypothetical protein KC318_g21749 [Hortaea werneckii]|nr:hypothetical protein KC318_g21749 [Hortaea werneckii]
MTTAPLLKPTLHVEVAVKPSKAHEVSSAQLRKEVKGWLTRHFDTVQVGIDISAELSMYINSTWAATKGNKSQLTTLEMTVTSPNSST